MDAVTHEKAMRIRDLAMSMDLADQPSSERKARAFVELIRCLMASPSHQSVGMLGAGNVVDTSSDVLVKSVAKAAAMTAQDWPDPAKDLAGEWIGSIGDGNLLDAIKPFARPLPRLVRRISLASGFVADAIAEGAPKIVRSINIAGDIALPHKVVAIVCVADEVVHVGGDAAIALIDFEMRNAVTRALNAAVLPMFVSTSVQSVPTTNDAMNDLRALVAAVAPTSTGIVVAAPPGRVADIAMRAENRNGMPITGGVLYPGLTVVAVAGETRMTAINCSRVSLRDYGVEARTSGAATIDMTDDPQSPAEAVNLWQTSTRGALVERSFDLIPGDAAVAITES